MIWLEISCVKFAIYNNGASLYTVYYVCRMALVNMKNNFKIVTQIWYLSRVKSRLVLVSKFYLLDKVYKIEEEEEC